ncbi:MAG: hypothetical protein JW837_09995 [Sedimentisphaerales bacterium]|nr:hypothetical protein [Sedimentisphaerales bacterium]
MFQRLIYVVSFVLVLSLVSSASAALPQGWQSEDINTTGGSADESGGTWTVSGDGADVWGTSDAFHFAYVPLVGDGQITARVVDNGTGSNTWAKGGVMIRETLDADSKHMIMALTGGDGSGIAFQGRMSTSGSSTSYHGDVTAEPPYWVRLTREGNTISAYISADGATWELFSDTSPDGGHTNPIDVEMADTVYVGLFVTSHAAGEIRTYTFDNVSTELPKVALGPYPADGALLLDTWVSLSWAPGVTAASHNVYFGENFNDVNDSIDEVFRGNQTSDFYVVGFPGFPYPDGLVPGSTYYWRVDEVEADGTTIHRGKVWSFSIPFKKAYNPSPPDGAAFIDPETNLSFSPGLSAKLHTIYFGDNFDDVNNASGGAPLGITTFDPGTLELNKTYYWRVDEFNPPVTLRGDVWSFTTTIEGLGNIVMERWNNLDGTDLNTLKESFKFPNSPDETIILDEFSTAIDSADSYGGRITGWLYAPATGDYTFWLCTDDHGELWLSTNDEPENVILIAQENDWSAANTWGSGTQKSDPIPLEAGERYYIEALWKEGSGGDHCQVAWQGPGAPTRTIIQGTNLSPYEPVQAFGANPGNGDIDISQITDLSWKAGIKAASHEIYFGTDADAVTNATTSSSEFKGTKNPGDESYDPGKLDWNTTYYWRIDEVNSANSDSPWTGKVWSFTTADFIIVDNMESYNDINPGEPGSNRIFMSWLDGFDNPSTNGSVVGYATPSFTEKTIVHGGEQSMPFFYDNTTASKSEATLTLTDVRNWTENGVDILKIWYMGNPAGFLEHPEGTFRLSGAGADVWGNTDEFRYAYKQLTGDGEIVARVVDVGTGSNTWAKAGVMIRETLEPDSKHMIMAMTGGDGGGIAFQGRQTTGGVSSSFHGDVTAAPPYWVKLTRSGNTITAYASSDGIDWMLMTDTTPDAGHTNPIDVPMANSVYIGLFITSHASGETRTAVFDNVQITGSTSLMWKHQAIGAEMTVNDPDAMYVALNNGKKVYNENPNAASISEWTEWNIDLQAFGVNLNNVNTITIGLDNSNNPAAGGSGLIFFDDIQLHVSAP